jgi:alkanesulfonate monooxygenase SsuD/methylene tetrahydromethanopterin reductase-like flavin-dependent oxidoreductase (luciferase family)
MNFGFYLPTRGQTATPDALEALVARGEGLGFHSVRGAVSNEYLRIFKTLWTQDPAEFAGQFYRFKGVRCLPHPVQTPHPPLWIGGHSRPALRRVAKYGDGWHPVGANPGVPLRPHKLQAALEDLKRLIQAEGRDPETMTVSFKAPLYDVSPST